MTTIQWTDEVWNPVTGCDKVSEGCRHCYAETIAHRFWGGRPFTEVRCHPERLEKPLHWKKPRRVFVNSMSDLFHEDVPDEFIEKVFTVMYSAKVHTFQVLTKRPKRMLDWISRSAFLSNDPPPNVWLGVSIEDQPTADERIPILLQTPASLRWVSYEPALGPVDLKPWVSLCRADLVTDEYGRYSAARHNAANEMRVFTQRQAWAMHWVVVGGEAGPKARPCEIAWIRSIIRQCQDAGVPIFCQQLGSHYRTVCDSKGGDPAEWPADLRVREYPR